MSDVFLMCGALFVLNVVGLLVLIAADFKKSDVAMLLLSLGCGWFLLITLLDGVQHAQHRTKGTEQRLL